MIWIFESYMYCVILYLMMMTPCLVAGGGTFSRDFDETLHHLLTNSRDRDPARNQPDAYSKKRNTLLLKNYI